MAYANPYATPQPAQPKPQPSGWSGGYDTPEQIQAFQDWYGKQQGGARPEDMARYKWTGNEEGKGNLSGDTFKRWDPYLVREGEGAGRYRSSRGAEGLYDKPTECPEGMVPSGPSETDPCVPAGAAGGGRRGPGGGGGTGPRGGPGGGGGWDNPIYNYLKGKALDEGGWLNTFLGQGGATGFQEQMDTARKQAMQIQDPTQRAAALAQLPQLQAQLMTGLKQSGEQARMGLLSGQLMPQEYQWGALGENARQANMQNALGWGNLGLEEKLGMGRLGLDTSAQQWQQGTYFPWQQSEAQANRDLEKWSLQEQLKAQKPSTMQKIAGVVGGLGGLASGLLGSGGLSSIFSDIRVKENITPLTALEHLPVYEYNYKWEPMAKRHIGVMAQDVEKLYPQAVGEVDGIKTVDLYSLLGITMSAVKELDRKVKRGRK